jgi:hypothetical protein
MKISTKDEAMNKKLRLLFYVGCRLISGNWVIKPPNAQSSKLRPLDELTIPGGKGYLIVLENKGKGGR